MKEKDWPEIIRTASTLLLVVADMIDLNSKGDNKKTIKGFLVK